MMSTAIKSAPLSCNFCWPLKSNKFVATVSISGDDDFSQDAYLQIHAVDLKDQRSTSLPTVAKIKLADRAQSIGWSSHGGKEGIVAVALVDGQVLIYSADLLLQAGKESGAAHHFLIQNESTGLLSRITQHAGTVRACEFNPQQPQILATGGADRELRVWNLADPKNPAPIPVCAKGTLHQTEITDIKWNPKVFNILVSSSQSGLVTVWDLKSKKVTATFNVNITTPQQSAAAVALSWHPSVPTLLAVARDEPFPAIQIWDVKKAMQPVQTLPVRELVGYHTGGLLSISWCPTDATLLTSCARDGQTLFWNPETGDKVGNLVVDSPQAVSWIPGVGAVCCVSSFDNHFGLYSTLAIGQGDKAPRWLIRPAPAVFGFGGRMALPATISSEIDPQAYIQAKIEAEKQAHVAATEHDASPEQQQAIITAALPPLTAVPIVAAPNPGYEAAAAHGYEATVTGRERTFQETLRQLPVRSQEWLQWVSHSLGQIAPSVVVSAESITEGSRAPLLRFLNVNAEEAQLNAYNASIAFDPSSAPGNQQDDDENDQDPTQQEEEDADEEDPFGEADGSAEMRRAQKEQQRAERESRRHHRALAKQQRLNQQPPSREDYERIMAQCIVSGCLNDAINLAIKANRFDDAFAAALVADSDQIRHVHAAYSEAQLRARRVFPQYISAISQKQWNDVAVDAAKRSASTNSDEPWREALALFTTWADAQGFSEATFTLAAALEGAHRGSDAAAVAAIGGHVDRAVALFSSSFVSRSQRGVDTTTLVQLGTLLEYINSVGVTAADSGAYPRVLLQHANDLAAESDFELALYYADRAGQLGLAEASVAADRLRFLVRPNEQVLGRIPIGPSRLPFPAEFPEAGQQELDELYAVLQRQQEEVERKQQQKQAQQQQQLQLQQQQEAAAAAAAARNNPNANTSNANSHAHHQQHSGFQNQHQHQHQHQSAAAAGFQNQHHVDPHQNQVQNNNNSFQQVHNQGNANVNRGGPQNFNNNNNNNNMNNNNNQGSGNQMINNNNNNMNRPGNNVSNQLPNNNNNANNNTMNNTRMTAPPMNNNNNNTNNSNATLPPRNGSNTNISAAVGGNNMNSINNNNNNNMGGNNRPMGNSNMNNNMNNGALNHPPPTNNNNNMNNNNVRPAGNMAPPPNNNNINNNNNNNNNMQMNRGGTALPPPPNNNNNMNMGNNNNNINNNINNQPRNMNMNTNNNNSNNAGPSPASTAPTPAAAAAPTFNYTHLAPNAQHVAYALAHVAGTMQDRRKRDQFEKAVAAFIAKAPALRPQTVDLLLSCANTLAHGNVAGAKAEWTKLVDNCWNEIASFGNLQVAMS